MNQEMHTSFSKTRGERFLSNKRQILTLLESSVRTAAGSSTTISPALKILGSASVADIVAVLLLSLLVAVVAKRARVAAPPRGADDEAAAVTKDKMLCVCNDKTTQKMARISENSRFMVDQSMLLLAGWQTKK